MARNISYLTVVTALIASGGASIQGTASEVPFLRGDATIDGVHDLTDAVLALNVMFLGRGKLRCEDAADANDDGELNISDPLWLLSFLFLGGPAPVGSETCLTDPTEDNLGCADPGEACQPRGPTEQSIRELIAEVTDNRADVQRVKELLALPEMTPRAARRIINRLRERDHGSAVVWSRDGRRPTFISGLLSDPDPRAPLEIAIDFIDEHAELYDRGAISEVLRFNAKKSNLEDPETGWSAVWFNQVLRGFPVLKRTLCINVDGDGVVRAVHGHFEPGLEPDYIPAQPAIGPGELEVIIRSELKFDGEFEYFKQPRLAVFIDNEHPYFVWRTEVLAPSSSAGMVFLVDAIDGTVRRRKSLAQHVEPFVPHVGIGNDPHGGQFNLNTSTFEPEGQQVGDYHLVDSTRNTVIIGYDINGSTSWGNPLPLEDLDNTWDSSDQEAECEGHRNMGLILDYFQMRHGRNSYDDQGSPILMGYHAMFTSGAITTGANAASIGNNGRFLFGDGDVTIGYPLPITSLDVVAHEFTHALLKAEGLLFQGEGQVIHEALADVFSIFVEEEFGNVWHDSNYMIGETLSESVSARDISAPSGSYVDHMSELDLSTPPHFNSTIISHAMYLMLEGGTHPDSGVTVNGLHDVSAVRSVFYKAVTDYLDPDPTFLDVRAAVNSAAVELFGSGSAESIAVQTAFTAVGITTKNINIINWADSFDTWMSGTGPVAFGDINLTPGVGYTQWELEDFSPAPTELDDQLGMRPNAGLAGWILGAFMITLPEIENGLAPRLKARIGYRNNIPANVFPRALAVITFVPSSGGSAFVWFTDITDDDHTLDVVDEDLSLFAGETGTLHVMIYNIGNPNTPAAAVWNRLKISHE